MALFYLKRSGFQFHQWWVPCKLVKFQQHTRKKPEDEKTQLNLPDILLPDHLT